jgi:hypothetical protein
MTVLDQGSLQFFLAHYVSPLTTLAPSSLMIPMNPQQFYEGQLCALWGCRPQVSVSL